MVPGAFEFEQDGAGASEFRGRCEPECLFACLAVGERVGDGAGGAGTSDEWKRAVGCVSFGGAFEPTVLVEQARVEVEDSFADDVEAEVPGFDHAGVDRADGDLVGVFPMHGSGPVGQDGVVVDEWAERFVTLESGAVEVVCLPLVPSGCG